MKKHWIVKEEPLAGSSTSNIIRLVWANKFRIHPKYWLRFWYAVTLSLICMPLRFIERLFFNRKIRRTKITQEPLFILGHWRTGTTYMNSLLALDKTKDFVSNKETYCPHFFLAFPRFVNWLITVSLPETRPMDEIKLGPDLPGEEEHSMGAYDKYGFFHTMIFPKNFWRFAKYTSFDDCPPKDLERWKRRYYRFVQKMTLKAKGKMLVLKNTANSYRIQHLYEMFPNAKFIHMYRNPYEVYPSSIRFHMKTNEIFALQTWDDEKLKKDVLMLYKSLYETYDEKKKVIPEENYIDVRYEDFIKEPMKFLEMIYQKFKLEGFEEHKEAFQKYIDSQADYKPATYDLTNELISQVNKHCDFMLKRFGYERLEPTTKE